MSNTSGTAYSPRDAERSDLDALAMLWFEGWQDAHADILPPEIKADRTFESFRSRLAEAIGDVRAIGPIGTPLGFSFVRGDELYQFYVDRSARGTGIAAILMADAEARQRQNGVRKAWLACAIGNDRAARFYEKSGWHLAGLETSILPLRTGDFPLDVWRYEKAL